MVLRACGWLVLRVLGWRVEGAPPSPPCVLIIAPHTSSWDAVILTAVRLQLGVHVAFLAKRELFRGVWGRLVRRLGGIAVERGEVNTAAKAAIDLLRTSGRVVLALFPEGTRRRRQHWATGFHVIARDAGVPVAMALLNYERRVVRFGPEFEPADDVGDDMPRIQRFFEDGRGRLPDHATPVRLRGD
jgi:1-acyl-sn-glycerol-3-phosphate acyltransferase